MLHLCARLIVGVLLLALPLAVRAQSPALLSLESAAVTLQTGQFYEVSIRLEDAADVWLADLQISYDPTLLYIMGTKAGSPVTRGTLFDPAASAVIRNEVVGDTLTFTLSMLSPAEPVSGSGVLGTIRVYPLTSGTTQMLFARAELSKAIFEQRDGQRVGIGAEALPFTPVLLELTLVGDTVTPPPEATATPLPTDTAPAPPTQAIPSQQPTLVNVTAAPRPAPPLVTLELPTAPAEAGLSPVTVIALAMIGLSLAGLVGVFLYLRRRR